MKVFQKYSTCMLLEIHNFLCNNYEYNYNHLLTSLLFSGPFGVEAPGWTSSWRSLLIEWRRGAWSSEDAEAWPELLEPIPKRRRTPPLSGGPFASSCSPGSSPVLPWIIEASLLRTPSRYPDIQVRASSWIFILMSICLREAVVGPLSCEPAREYSYLCPSA